MNFFYKKEELEENSLCRRYENERHRIKKKKKKIVSVLESKILIDATILYQSLGDMRK